MTSQEPQKVTLFLECGAKYEVSAWGDFQKPRGAELVFSTAMSGLEESLTDPSFAGQLVISTVAHVGNTGVNGEDMESGRIWAEGLVCRHLSESPSNWRTQKSLRDWVVEEGRILLFGVDTRELATLLRERGSQKVVVSGRGFFASDADARDYLMNEVPSMAGRELVSEVTCQEAYLFEEAADQYWPFLKEGKTSNSSELKPDCKIGVWDFGVKKNTLRLLRAMGAEVHVFPAHAKSEEIVASGIHGLLLSNGPGDPSAVRGVVEELKKLLGTFPIFAICLGHQLVSRAVGGRTEKMKFGHRGIHHPVVQLDGHGKSVKTWITSQNHGFAVVRSTLPKSVKVNFVHADDESVEGMWLEDFDCQTVQFHPEAGPGTYDAVSLIENFVEKARAHARK